MIQTLVNVFKIPELRNKLLFTLAMLIVYRVGYWIPLPGVNDSLLKEHFQQQTQSGSALGQISSYISVFSGGAFSQSTIFGLGIMPYITAGIIFQLLASVLPQLKKLQEEGPTGRQKIMEWTRYATVALCIVQGMMWIQYMVRMGMVYPSYAQNPLYWIMATAVLTGGTVFLMWLGEQIDRFGIGNGMSMIIMAGILARMPEALMWVVNNFGPGEDGKMGWGGLLMLATGFVGVIAGSVLMTVAQRRIPVQQAKHTRGRRVFGGQRSYLPLRINHGGVMPIVFASSLMLFPSVIFTGIADALNTSSRGGAYGLFRWLADNFHPGEFPYVMLYIVMVYFFSYFWITVQFNPEEMSKQLRDHGSFIPGLRPGPRTAEYLETVMNRITFVGAAFLSLIAVLPMVVNKNLKIDYAVTQFLGGTGLLIVVSVSLDFLQRVEANLLMRNYAGFLSGGEDGTSPRMRSARG
ncbi:MAG: preprotein translocase subunit SecY [Phycisphaerales bacterium]|nr:preprotein translocase subunit SecY [Phycisphaerales bacterium]